MAQTKKKKMKAKIQTTKPSLRTVVKQAPKSPWKVRARRMARWVGAPLLIYFLFFAVYTWPWLPHFSNAFMTDAGDGLQNVWNIWWINKSVTELHQLPWHTMFLHAPHGITLLGQTLNPFNGFVAIGLLQFLSLTQAFNVMIIFSFVVAGLTTFWLCYYFSKSYWASIVGGFIYTFSSYHFAHAIGHMQLVSLEWIPLFILLWWKLLKRPSYSLAAGTSLALLLVLFCDYYYFLYSVLAAVIIFLYFWRSKQLPSLKKRAAYLPLGLFIVLSLFIVAPLPIALLLLNHREVLAGSHPARELSTNFLAPFIDGGYWRFGRLTDFYWNHVPGTVAESSVYLGISTITLSVIAIFKRKVFSRDINIWIILGLFFGVMSLGPRLMVGGNSIELIPLPYSLMEQVFPPIKISGVPVRMMVIVTLCVAVVSAMVLAKVNLARTKYRVWLAVFGILLFVEMFPAQLLLTPNTYPAYASALKKLPAGVVYNDGVKTAPQALYDQTLFDKPMVLGYVSRTPKSVEDKDWLIVASILERRYSEVCSVFRVRYYTVSAKKPIVTSFPILYQDKEVIIYDFKNSPNC